MLHKVSSWLAVLLVCLYCAGCGYDKPEDKDKQLVIAATPVPHAEILEKIQPILKQEGFDLQIKVINDYVQPATLTNQHQVDGNFFAHKPYLEAFKKNHPDDQEVPIVAVHIEPMAAYSLKYHTIADIPDGAIIAIPNDPTNSGRALLLLAGKALIRLKDENNIAATTKDIVDNPKHFQFRELDAAMLPRSILTPKEKIDVAIINANYAIEAQLNPVKDSLLIEDAQSSYANWLVAREDNKNSAKIQKLAQALCAPEVQQFIKEKYQGAVISACEK